MSDHLTTDTAGEPLEPLSARDPEQWALGAEGLVDPGEADARIILEDKRLSRAVRQATKKLEAAGKLTRRPARGRLGRAEGMRPRNAIPAAPSTLKGWREALHRAELFVVLFVPVLPMLFPPGGRYGGVSEQAALRFFEVSFASYLLVCAIQLVLLVAWALHPLRWEGTRLLSAGITLLMLLFIPWWVLMGTAEVPPRIWGPQLIPFGLAMPLAAANLWAWKSERSQRLRHLESITEMRTMLREDSDPEGGEDGPRGPVRELRRTVRRFPEREQLALDRRRADVLAILESRGLIAPRIAEQAADLPLGRWHVLDERIAREERST